ncbi:MAG: hypothetical protein NTU79_23610 [Planctomycetota bacterium]|nr:hypothetical protein [Planctomycetota bacterium]
MRDWIDHISNAGSKPFRLLVAVALVTALSLAASAQDAPTADAPSFPCGGTNPKGVVLWPLTKFTNAEFTNPGADCAMWQNFIYLNWPAAAGKRGVPDTSAAFGTPGTTVWETFLTADQVFLPGGIAPQKWDESSTKSALPDGIAQQVAGGRMRLLSQKSKVSPAVAKVIKKVAANSPGLQLTGIEQAFDSGILYDQQKVPVYYEVAMNKVQFDYIFGNQLYNANTQATFAATTNIVLPTGSMELKAAWKVLTPAETNSGRFHTAKGFIPGSNGNGQNVDIGLVGMHVFASEGKENAGLWATFYQIDNAPVQGGSNKGPFSFNNPASNAATNSNTTNPTQVVQVFADDPSSVMETAEAQKMFRNANPASPWQYYAMIATQWSQAVLDLDTPVPATVPLSPGKPGQVLPGATLVNPVLETFMQTKGTGCMSCHSAATIANSGSIASGFSFMFGRAQAPDKP